MVIYLNHGNSIMYTDEMDIDKAFNLLVECKI
jgi:hypothetical protein